MILEVGKHRIDISCAGSVLQRSAVVVVVRLPWGEKRRSNPVINDHKPSKTPWKLESS